MKGDPGVGTTIVAVLTRREHQVLMAFSFGYSNPEIAKKLGIRESSVKSHARRVYSKLKARDRPHAVRLGVELGLLQPRVIQAVGEVVNARVHDPMQTHIAACYEARLCPCRGGQVGGDG